MKRRNMAIILTIALLLWSLPVVSLAATNSQDNLNGAIWTTNSSGTAQNLNPYDAKQDVYVKGGKDNHNHGLTDGWYYMKVESPQGTLLGKSTSANVHVVNAVFGPIKLWDNVEKISNGAQGYDDTNNNGGEYKVTLSMNAEFPNQQSKTDNFKVKVTTSSPSPSPSTSPSPSNTASTSPSPSNTASTSPSPSNTASMSPSPSNTASTSPSPSNTASTSPSPSDTASTSPSPSEQPSVPSSSTVSQTNVALTVLIEGPGSVLPGSGAYGLGSIVQMLTTPADGAVFVGWFGPNGAEVTDNRILMTSNKEITARFEIPQTFAAADIPLGAPPVVTQQETPLPEAAPANAPADNVVLEQTVPQAAPSLPKTGGLPIGLFGLMGALVTGAGVKLRRK